MAFLGSAVRRVASAVRPPLSPLCRTSTRSYSSEHTKEKSVPYEKTLKQDAGAASGPTKPLPRSADVVVIGGGSLGCQTVYHLAKMGMTNVVLLERDRLTAGTTWHTAGLLWQLRPSDVEVELLGHTRNVVSRDLEEETGLHTGWIQNGGLFIASNKQRLDEYKRLMSLGKVYGIESHVLSPAETKDVYPLMNVDDLYGTLYVPTDGTMDPAGTCTTLTRAASARGATVIENCPVTGIQVRADDLGVKRVKAVETAHGTIETPCVVNCAGVWATKLGKMAGVNVPLVAMHHAYVVTERIEGIQNMPNVRDHDASVYLRLQGDALSVGGYEPNPIFWDDVSDKFAFSLFDLDWDVFMTHIEGAINRVPVLEQTGIKSTVCGPESFTADHKPLMGEAPEVRGFFLGCGFNSAGMMLGGGCGRELAHWVIHGRPERDMYGYDIRYKNENYKYNELLGKEYTFDFPPHHDVIKAECLSCRHGVAVFDMSYFGKFYLTGPDAKKAADWLFTADVNKKPGRSDAPLCYTCMLNKRGGAEADPDGEQTGARFLQPSPVLLLCFPLFAPGDAYYLAIGGGVAEHNWNHIRTVLQDQGFRCQLTDHSEDMGMISIQGPKRGGGREGILQEVLDTDLSNEAFPFSSHKVVKAAGHQVSADFIKSGEFTLERMGVTYKARAHLKSPFDPENKRVKGIYA
uniref:Sarcosine dehydrogenase n=1 Tax=Salarias fasciatus TaxID=181472 RepID=A0A672J2I2_SALFA